MTAAPGRPGLPGRPGAHRGLPAPPAVPLGRPVLVAVIPPTRDRSWWSRWWAPLVQAVTIVAVLLTSSAIVDVRREAIAADLAADRGLGMPAVTVVKRKARAAAPTTVDIARLGISSNLVQLRKQTNGTLEVPKDFSRAGWYVGSAHPGDPGPTVIVGHVDSFEGPAVFYRLTQLKQGDRITVRRADRSNIVFVVDSVRTYSKRDFPTALVYRGDGKPGLRLVTCGGAFDRRSKSYLSNTVVIARPASAASAKPAPAQPKAAKPAPRPTARKALPRKAVPVVRASDDASPGGLRRP